MLKLNFRILGLLVITSVCAAGLLTGCGKPGATTGSETQSQENVADFYNQVQIGQTKAEVDALLGVTPTEPVEGAFQYLDENGNGVTVFYMERIFGDGSPKVALSKRMIGTEKIIAFTPDEQRITDEQAAKITEGMTYDEVKSILGQDGLEVSATVGANDVPAIERYWIKNGMASMISVTFTGPSGTDTSKLVLNY